MPPLRGMGMNRPGSRETRSVASQRTVSELLFEQYLRENGYTDREHEPAIPGKSRRPDYRIGFAEQSVICEVKELTTDEPIPLQPYSFDPRPSIRRKIIKAGKQFSEYKKWPCVLVLFRKDGCKTHLTPRLIMESMLGNIESVTELDPDNDERLIARNVFAGGGKMVDPYTGQAWNTTFSAIAILAKDDFQDAAFQQEHRNRLRAREAWKKIKLGLEEQIQLGLQMRRDYPEGIRKAPHLDVVLNPFARRRLPSGIFRGPFDIQWEWNRKTSQFRQIFLGEKALHNDLSFI